jgi:nicotinamidase/pyrazinamidase
MMALESVLAYRKQRESSLSDTALLIVDAEQDRFSGAREVEGAEEILPALQCYLERFQVGRLPVFASRYRSRRRTISCDGERGCCAPGASGGELARALALPDDAVRVSREPQFEEIGCSAFLARSASGVPLEELLQRRSVHRLCIGGLLTEQAVWATALDARRRGFQVVLLLDAIHGRDRGEIARALDEMLRAGSRTATLATIGREVPAAEPRLSDAALRRVLSVDPGRREDSD